MEQEKKRLRESAYDFNLAAGSSGQNMGGNGQNFSGHGMDNNPQNFGGNGIGQQQGRTIIYLIKVLS